MPRIAVTTMGCRLNHAESESIQAQLQANGHQVIGWDDAADWYVLNSCTVTATAAAQVGQMLRAVRRKHPHAQIALTGCHAQVASEQLLKQGISDLVVGNTHKHELPTLINHHHKPPPAESCAGAEHSASPELNATPHLYHAKRFSAEAFRQPFFDASTIETSATRSVVKVQDGCSFGCSFCIIPRARGGQRSRVFDEVIAEVQMRAAAGVKEVVLSGVNIGTYEQEENNLLNLIDAINEVDDLARIRISSIEPTTVDHPILERMASPTHKLVPFLHLPLQSASDNVLHAMRRRYSAEHYRQFALQALKQVPNLCLGTDVMTGFPSETEEDFELTHAFIRDLPFAYLHVFPFSARPHTIAERLPCQATPAVMKQRAHTLRQLSTEKRRQFNQRFIGSQQVVLFEKSTTPTIAAGYTPHYVRVQVSLPDAEKWHGKLATVKLLEAGENSIAGVLLS